MLTNRTNLQNSFRDVVCSGPWYYYLENYNLNIFFSFASGLCLGLCSLPEICIIEMEITKHIEDKENLFESLLPNFFQLDSEM